MSGFLHRLSAFFLLFPALFCRGEVLRDPATGKAVRHGGDYSSAPVVLGPYRPRARSFRGVWAATVLNLDFGPHKSRESFMRDYRQMVQRTARARFNALIFQIRPNCDAFYASALNPWSRWLTGQEGRGLPGFDPLPFMISEAHKNRLEFHAWLNPYRVVNDTKMKKSAYLATLAPGNFARRHPEWVLEVRTPRGRTLLLDPGVPEVTKHIAATVEEILRKYPVDAIHFDDYFYPYDPVGNADKASFLRYNPRRLPLAEWRRENVNRAIRAVRAAVLRCRQQTGRRVEFGISPFGIWANRRNMAGGSLTGGKESYFIQYADTRRWVRERLIDYVVPQVYWTFAHPKAAYAAVVDFWAATVRGTGVKLYIGQAPYRLGEAGWGERELCNQLRYDSAIPEISGEVWFSWRHVFAPGNKIKQRGLQAVWQNCWRAPVPPPQK